MNRDEVLKRLIEIEGKPVCDTCDDYTLFLIDELRIELAVNEISEKALSKIYPVTLMKGLPENDDERVAKIALDAIAKVRGPK